MTLIKDIISQTLNEDNNINNLKPGIYDMQGTPIQNIVGSDRMQGSKLSNYSKQYLLPNQILGLFKNLGWKLNINLFNALRDNEFFKPTGYYIDKNHKKYNVYSYNRFCTLMVYGWNDGHATRDKDNRFVLTPLGHKLYNQYVINKPVKPTKKEIEDQKYQQNLAMRQRYDTSENIIK